MTLQVMTRLYRICAMALLPATLLTSSGVRAECAPMAAVPVATHHAGHEMPVPAPLPGHHECPGVPGAACIGMVACATAVALPVATLAPRVAASAGTPAGREAALAAIRALPPDSPPPRA